MLLREESVNQSQTCCPIGNDLSYNDSLCCTIQNKRVLSVLWQLKHAAVIPCRRSVLDAIIRDLLHCLWRIGLAATSPMHWEAYLLWMSPGWMSPVWGCSVLYPFWGTAVNDADCDPHIHLLMCWKLISMMQTNGSLSDPLFRRFCTKVCRILQWINRSKLRLLR